MANEIPHRQANSKARLSIIWVGLVLVAFGYLQFGERLSLGTVVQQESELRAYQQERPCFVYVTGFFVYVVMTGFSLPGAAVLTLICGWLFGFLPGLILVSFASTSGASLAFLLSRHVFSPVLEPYYGNSLQAFRDSLARDGAFYLFTLRLIPAVPFVGINLLMGLTPIGLGTFWWVSQLGMLPATVVYVSAGAAVPELSRIADSGIAGLLSPRLLGAFMLLALLPLLLRLLLKRLGRSSESVARREMR